MILAWFLKTFACYVSGSVVRLIKTLGSGVWPLEYATVSSSSRSAVYGGPIARITYTYRHQGRLFTGQHAKSFLLQSSAEQYAATYPVGSTIFVRIKPGQPITTIVHDDDQSI